MFNIEKAGIDDINNISILAKNIYLKYNASLDTKEGINNVCLFIDNMKYRFNTEGSLILIARNYDKDIIGVLEMTNYDHISLLFVDDKYFKNGIGASMFEKVKDILESDKYTVKASSYALDFYKKLGFLQIFNDIQEENGVHFYSMIY